MTDEQTTTTYAEYPEGSNGYWYVRRGPGARPLATVWSPDAETGAKLYAAAEELLAACEPFARAAALMTTFGGDAAQNGVWTSPDESVRLTVADFQAAAAALAKARKD